MRIFWALTGAPWVVIVVCLDSQGFHEFSFLDFPAQNHSRSCSDHILVQNSYWLKSWIDVSKLNLESQKLVCRAVPRTITPNKNFWVSEWSTWFSLVKDKIPQSQNKYNSWSINWDFFSISNLLIIWDCETCES